MFLRYPNARLYVHSLMTANKGSGRDAIATAACDYGLIPRESAQEIRTSDSSSDCGCLFGCKQIVDKYLQAQHAQSRLLSLNAAEMLSDIEHEVKTSQGSTQRHDCNRFAPALFDLILQQIHRYE